MAKAGTSKKTAVKKALVKKAAKKADEKKSLKKAGTKRVSPKKPLKAASSQPVAKKTSPSKAAATKPASGAATAATAAKADSYRLKVGDKVPEVTCPATSGKTISNADWEGHTVVLYFYPKDNTPGCTLEGQDFRRLHEKFKKAGCLVFGVSKDSVKSHENFKAKCDFPFELLCDSDEKACRAFDVIQMKTLYGRKFEGIERSTFVIDRQGYVAQIWRKVKVAGHAEEVLNFVESL